MGRERKGMVKVTEFGMSRIEEIRSAAQAHYPSGTNHEEIKVASFIRGARYADKTMLDKAYEWIIGNMPKYVKANQLDVFINNLDMASDFRKVMEK